MRTYIKVFTFFLVLVLTLVGINVLAQTTPGVSHPAGEIYGTDQSNPTATERLEATFPQSYYWFQNNAEAGGEVIAGIRFATGGAELLCGLPGVYCRVGTESGGGGFSIQTEGTERVTVDTDGYVGIGTTNPAQLLHLRRNESEGPMIRLDRTANSNINDVAIMGIAYYTTSECSNESSPWTTTDSFWIGRGTSNPEKTFVLRLNSGNIGLGTVCPEYKVTLGDSLGNYAGIHLSPSAPSGLSGTLAFYNGQTISSSNIPRMIITSPSHACPGCVGIHKVNPTDTLDVEGTVRATSYFGNGGSLGGITCPTGCENVGSTTVGADTDETGDGEIHFTIGDSSLGSRTRMLITNTGRIAVVPDLSRAFANPVRTFCIGAQGTCIDNAYDASVATPSWPSDLDEDTLAFLTNNAERMRIAGNGEIGIGTTVRPGGPDPLGDLHISDDDSVTVYLEADVNNDSAFDQPAIYFSQGGEFPSGNDAAIGFFDGSDAFTIQHRDGYNINLGPSSNPRMVIEGGGDVIINTRLGIGIASPTNPLHVIGKILAENPGGDIEAEQWIIAGSGVQVGGVTLTSSGIGSTIATDFAIRTSNFNRLIVGSGGSVTIPALADCRDDKNIGTTAAGLLFCDDDDVGTPGSGTAGRIAKWAAGGSSLEDSIINESGGNVYITNNGGLSIDSGIRLNDNQAVTRPNCANATDYATNGGSLWFTSNAPAQDCLEMCASTGTGYDWVPIYGCP